MKQVAINVLIAATIPFGIYFLIAFADWIFRDPLHLIEDHTWVPARLTPWERCTSDAARIFDQFNDTPATTYGTNDQPSQSVKEFMEFCLSKNP